jgi:hypothetical protein
MKKYKLTTESYQSGTTWIALFDTSISFHCGYWTGIKSDEPNMAQQRNSYERNHFVFKLVEQFNYWIENKDSYVPFVSLPIIKHYFKENKLYFVCPLFGELELANMETNTGEWEPKEIPEDFKNLFDKFMERVVECDKQD